MSDLREAEVEDISVEFAQRSGEAVPAQVLAAELAEEQTACSDRLQDDDVISQHRDAVTHLLQSFLGRLMSSMCDRMVTSWVA